MKAIQILTLFIFYAACNAGERNETQEFKSEKVTIKSDTLKLIRLVRDGFFKNSYLKIKSDTILFVHDDIYRQPGIHNEILLFFDSFDNSFKYLSSVRQQISDDSLQFLQRDNILRKIIKGEKSSQRSYYKEISKQKRLKLHFLNEEVKVNTFNNKYYILNRVTPDSLFQVDLVAQTVNAFKIKDPPLDVMNFLLIDLDKDGNPEIVLFHENLIPQADRLLYDIFSLRRDSIKIDVVHKN
jgi:hypothetical protein